MENEVYKFLLFKKGKKEKEISFQSMFLVYLLSYELIVANNVNVLFLISLFF